MTILLLPSTKTWILSLFIFSIPFIPFSTAAILDIFNVQKGGRDVASCDDYLAVIDTAYTESLTLVNVALTALNGYANDITTKRLLDSYFGIKTGRREDPTDDIAAVQGFLERIRKFLLKDDGPKLTLPYLFCGSEWLLPVDIDDFALNSEGNIGFFNGGLASIGDVYGNELYIKEKGNFITDAEGNYVPNGNVPFQILYTHATEYITAPPGKGDKFFDSTSVGGTQTDKAGGTITLCRDGLALRAGYLSDLGAATITVGHFLKEYQPLSSTLYHELFHLVIGSAETPDVWNYNLMATINALAYHLNDKPNKEFADLTNTQLAKIDPETYYYFSLACYYAQTGDSNGNKFDFATGKAKVIR